MKFTKFMVIIVMALLMQGCAYSVDSWEIERASKACADKGGIDYLVPSNSYVRCQDGTDFYYNE